MNKTLSFENNDKKTQQRTNLIEKTNNKPRLSEVIKQQQIKDELNDLEDDKNNFMETDDHEMKKNKHSNMEKTKKKRLKTKSKGEIRDKVDRMISSSRNKPQLPQRTKKKWFE